MRGNQRPLLTSEPTPPTDADDEVDNELPEIDLSLKTNDTEDYWVAQCSKNQVRTSHPDSRRRHRLVSRLHQ